MRLAESVTLYLFVVAKSHLFFCVAVKTEGLSCLQPQLTPHVPPRPQVPRYLNIKDQALQARSDSTEINQCFTHLATDTPPTTSTLYHIPL